MERIFFEEKQKLATFWSWIVVLAGLGISFPLLRILYLNLILGEVTPWTVKRAVLFLCLLVIVLGVIVWLTATYSLEVKIGPSGIYYRSFPSHDTLTRIDKESIVEYVIREVHLKDFFNSVSEVNFDKPKSMLIYSIAGSTVLEVKLLGERKILLGTQNKESLAWAMRRLLDNPA